MTIHTSNDRLSQWARAFLVALIVFCGPFAHAAAFTAEQLFESDRLIEVEITMPPANWEALRNESDRSNGGFGRLFGGQASKEKRFHYYQGDITIDGIRIPTVGLRTKGFIGSLNPERPSIKVKFDEYVDQAPIDGLDRLTLNNNNQDGSLCSQYLTYHLFNKAGIPAPRVSFAKVTVNGEYLGVYCNVESVRDPFLNKHFGDASGEFYEGTISDFYPNAVENIEAKNKRTEKDRSRAIALAALLETEETFDLEQIEKAVNVESFLTFWAMESLLGFWDGYTNNQNNYFAYSNPRDEHRFHFMPWGADGAFSEGRGPFGRGDGDQPLSVYNTGMLNHRLYQAAGIPEQYRKAMESILKDVWEEKAILTQIDRIRELTKDHLHDGQRRGGGFGRGGFGRFGGDSNETESQDAAERNTAQLKRFVENRRALIESELDRWPVTLNGDPRIPSYSVEIGKVSGSFQTLWKGERWDSLGEEGQASLEMTLNGQELSFQHVAVLGQPEQQRGWGRGGPPGRGGPGGNTTPNPTIRFEATETGSGREVTMDLIVKRDAFKSGKKKIAFDGSLSLTDPNESENDDIFRRFMDRKSLRGTLKLSQAGTEEDAAIEGSIKLEIWENRGGFGRGPGGPRGRGR